MQAVAKALVGRGHEVVWLASADNETLVRSTGAVFALSREVEAFITELDRGMPASALPVQRPVTDLLRALAPHIADYRQVLADFPAHCLVVDCKSPYAQALYELGEIPTYATVGLWPIYADSARLPPFGSGRHPPTSWLGLLRNWLVHQVKAWVLIPLSGGFVFNRARLELGLPPLTGGKVSEYFPYSKFAHIQASCPELEYSTSLKPNLPSPNTHYVGPLVAPSTKESPLPEWWGEVIRHDCLIGVTQGTLKTDPSELIIPTIQALTDKEGVLVIVLTKKIQEIRELLPVLPPHVYLIEWLPYDTLLRHAKVLLTNGGYGGVTQALSHGVPLVCAGREADEPDTAARVSWVGAGVNLATDRPSSAQIRVAVDKVLGEESYKKDAQQMRERLRVLSGADRACEVLEALASKHA
ncbi:UDP-Glycosyltransferase/glycogen phosphorylase [Thozetella sp. PMI_491]|nr:UDP-Glycosyltransferase/glycogen phosphorylase [Thozetella sp. PMI_491]